jgi:hypothetical protein
VLSQAQIFFCETRNAMARGNSPGGNTDVYRVCLPKSKPAVSVAESRLNGS